MRLLELLAELRELGGRPVAQSEEVRRQATLICQHARALAETEADREMIDVAYQRLHG